jgi:predicted enzyme related to lactoylglutathione lyase
MLSDLPVIATLPAANLERAKKFYAEKLGLTPEMATPDGGLYFKCKGSAFMVYPSQFAGTAKNTAAGFQTEDIEKTMRELRARGVVFEEYDLPGLKTVGGVATFGKAKSAWFRDSEGNILALDQM